jgi:hypothetical protein
VTDPRDGVPMSKAESERSIVRRLNAIVASKHLPPSATGDDRTCRWCGLHPRKVFLCDVCIGYHERLLEKYPDERRAVRPLEPSPDRGMTAVANVKTPPWMPFKEPA